MAPSRSRTELGFTLTELMIVVAIAAIVTTIALPSFNDAIQRNRMAAQTNEVIAGINLARTAGLQANAGGTICAANAAQTACGGSWANGWIIWVDVNRNGSMQPDELRGRGEMNSKDQMIGTNLIAFDGRGRRVQPTVAEGNAVMEMQPTGCVAGKPFLRTLTVNAIGSVGVAKGVC